ncbi:MAG: hypothetical protein ISS56_20410 [Anaerolineae bacterium]|nr:hypothetical protein [Anaerolineae bacterium]
MAELKNTAGKPNEESKDESLQLVDQAGEEKPTIIAGTILEHYMSASTLETLLEQLERRLGVPRAA